MKESYHISTQRCVCLGSEKIWSFPRNIPSLKLTASLPLKIGRNPIGSRIVFQPSICRGELLVSGRVSFAWRSYRVENYHCLMGDWKSGEPKTTWKNMKAFEKWEIHTNLNLAVHQISEASTVKIDQQECFFVPRSLWVDFTNHELP